jgi:dephospho-CoA kinase
MKQLKIGVTGYYHCGKGFVSHKFEEWFLCHYIDADHEAHAVYEPGNPAHVELVKRFGNSILRPDQTIDRSKLSDIVFAGGTGLERMQYQLTGRNIALESLNKIVWPPAIERLEKQLEEPYDRFVLEASMLIQSKSTRLVNPLVFVECEEEVILERVKKLGQSVERAKHILRMQRNEMSYVEGADYVINNSGTMGHTYEQILHVARELGIK